MLGWLVDFCFAGLFCLFGWFVSFVDSCFVFCLAGLFRLFVAVLFVCFVGWFVCFLFVVVYLLCVLS